MAQPRLMVFLRLPQLGQVKTRLAAELGSEAALEVYHQLLAATMDSLRELDSVELRQTPEVPPLSHLLPVPRRWICSGQGSGDLGARMERAFREGFSRGLDRIVVVGTDCPYLTADDIRAAWAALKAHDLVLGPATDGGYWLLGLRRPCPDLFRSMAWGSDTVCRETLRRAADSGLDVALLRELSDVDTRGDWEAYRRWRDAKS